MSGLFLSNDNGSTWTPVNTGLSPTNHVNAFTVSGNYIFAGTYDVGVFLSTNNGTTWASINTGLNNAHVYKLAVKGDTIFAGCNNGVWRRSISELFQTSCSAQFTLTPDSLLLHHYTAVNFASGAMPLSYYWSWGDGSYSTTAFPSHTYSSAGYYDICLSITDAVGCTSIFCDSTGINKSNNTIASIDVVPPSITAIDELSNATLISVFPNPSNGLINITLAEKATDTKLEVLNSCGQVLLSKEINNSTQTSLDLSNHSKGIYFIKVQNGNGVVVRKVVISE
jgi:hypothetical protein